jgi:hypothetical protein
MHFFYVSEKIHKQTNENSSFVYTGQPFAPFLDQEARTKVPSSRPWASLLVQLEQRMVQRWRAMVAS